MNYVQKALEDLGIANGEWFRLIPNESSYGMDFFSEMELMAVKDEEFFGGYAFVNTEYIRFQLSTNRCFEIIVKLLSGDYHIELIPQFTEDEKAFVRLCEGIKYVVRDNCGTVFGYSEKPKKDPNHWSLTPAYINLTSWFPQLKLSAIKWTDDKPWSREEILK